ncbi:MAG: LytTR family DNA-binding domain-containing protein [Clostridium sp.]
MNTRHYTKRDIINMTQHIIHCFCEKNVEDFVSTLDEDFVWIGDYAPLYMRGRDNFLSTVQAELGAQSVSLSEEEYTLLAGERHLWVTYGRFTAASGSGHKRQETKVHITFVWKQKADALKLILANATHVRELPEESEHPDSLPVTQSTFFTRNQTKYSSPEKRMFRDMSGNIHYLFLDEILYIEARDKLCTVFTENGSFSTRSTLKEQEGSQFILIHRSYLVNITYIHEFHRYKVLLANGVQLPIGKERYMALKARLTPTV